MITRRPSALLAEALVLAALMGSLLKDQDSQLTMQAQTEAGIVDMLVCDYRGGELRGYVRHDAEGWPNAPARTPASPR
jgi:molecular chaperone Hsp33